MKTSQSLLFIGQLGSSVVTSGTQALQPSSDFGESLRKNLNQQGSREAKIRNAEKISTSGGEDDTRTRTKQRVMRALKYKQEWLGAKACLHGYVVPERTTVGYVNSKTSKSQKHDKSRGGQDETNKKNETNR